MNLHAFPVMYCVLKTITLMRIIIQGKTNNYTIQFGGQ